MKRILFSTLVITLSEKVESTLEMSVLESSFEDSERVY